MAHELTQRESGFVEMAFTGARSAVWHGLGNELEVGATHEEWRKASGLDWECFSSPVTYSAFNGKNVDTMNYPDRVVIFRSDTQKPLSIVSDDYKIVQPAEVLEFFNDVALHNKMRLSTAGSLFGGKRFWALAETFKEADIVPGDTVKGYLLLTTSVDGTLATTAKFTSTRVVCNNTLTVALSEKTTNNMFKKSHRSVWDAREAKLDLGLIDTHWNTFIDNLKKFAETEVSNDYANKIFKAHIYDPKILEQDQSWGDVRKVNKLMELYTGGVGSNYSNGTLWGVMNAVTELNTHGSGKRDTSHQFWDSYNGKGDKEKSKFFESLLELV